MRKFLFAGCGSVGRRHIRNLRSLTKGEIHAFRVRRESLGDFEREYGIRTFTELEEALDQRPAAVFVTNPTSLHLGVALKAAERGLPLFIEKPLSHSLEGVDELIRICEAKRLTAFVAYKMRFHKSIRKIKEIVESGALGRIISGRAHYSGYLPKWHPWEDYRRQYSSRSDLGGGVVLDATHEIDYLRWLLGEVTEVKSLVGKVGDLETDTEDTAEILLRFASGAFGSVHMSYAEQPEHRYCHVLGSKGSVYWDQLRRAVILHADNGKGWQTFDEGEGHDLDRMFVEEMRHFLECLEGRSAPAVGLRDGKKVLEIALQAKNAFAAAL
jgi:predicted dehydrogenase